MDAHALHRRGWSISAIARHLGHDRKTIRAYLRGDRVAGQRARSVPHPFEPFVGYCRERLAEDPHLWATTLFEPVGRSAKHAGISTAVDEPASGSRISTGG